MLAIRGWIVLGRSFGKSCFQQKFGEPIPISSTIISRLFATKRDDKEFPVIKRAKGPYLIFSEEKRSDVVDANPGLKTTDVSKILGGMWRGLTEDEKQIYRQKFEKEKEELKKSQEGIIDNLTPEQKEMILEKKMRKKSMKKIKMIKALKKSSGKPKPSDTNPFLLFVKSKMLDRGDAPLTAYVQGASDYWKKMTEEDKKSFVDEAKRNSQKYRLALAEWEKKMLFDGKEDVFSKSRLSLLKKEPSTKNFKTVAKKTKHSEKVKDLDASTIDNKAAQTSDLPDKKAKSDNLSSKKK